MAQLNQATVATPLNTSQVNYFGLREALYIYMVFCAWAGKFGESAETCEALIARLACLVAQPPQDDAGLAELKSVDEAVQALRGLIPAAAAADYQQDQRLTAMYSPGIQKRELS